MPHTTIDYRTSVVCYRLTSGLRPSVVSGVLWIRPSLASHGSPSRTRPLRQLQTKTNKLCIKWKTALKVVSVGGHGFARILWAASLRQASANSPQRPGGEVGEVDSGPERSRGEPSAPEYNNYSTTVRGRAPTYDSTSQFKIIYSNPTWTS